jgi:amidase
MTTDLHYLELSELAAHLQARRVSPIEVTRAQLDRIAGLDGTLGAYAFVMADEAMAAAKVAEAEIAAGYYRGPLHGVPIGVKDVFWTKDAPTAAGMPLYRDFRPPEDATVVARLKRAGAVLLGKLQMTEGAYSDHHPSVIPPKNPWNPDYWTGISSSGAAAALGAGLCYGAVASDTGGSIRWPCGAMGLTGLKPTWGRVSRSGMFELARSLDHAGPMARSVVDVAALYAEIAGHDANDPTSLVDPIPSRLAMLATGVLPLRIGVDPQWNSDGVHISTQIVLSEALAVFRTLGATTVEIAAPDVTQSVVDWAPACAVEAALAHEATYPARKDEYGPVLASVLEAGRAVSGIDYERIRRRRLELRDRFAHVFETVDLLLTPVHPFQPLSLASVRTLGDQPDLILALQRYTAPFDLTGNPTLTVPGGFGDGGVPIGFQLVAADLGEGDLINAGAEFQGATVWHRHHPLVATMDATEP